jgi:hypothetical protein
VTYGQSEFENNTRGETASLIWRLLMRVLPSAEAVPEELAIWHPELSPLSYTGTGTYPRCWIYKAALMLGLDYPDYASRVVDLGRSEWPSELASLVSALPRAASILEDKPIEEMTDGFDGMVMRDGTLVRTNFVERLSDWRRILDTFMSLDPGRPKSMPRSLILGLLLASRFPDGAKVLVSWMHVHEQAKFRTQLEEVRAFVENNPLDSLESAHPSRCLDELLPLHRDGREPV